MVHTQRHAWLPFRWQRWSSRVEATWSLYKILYTFICVASCEFILNLRYIKPLMMVPWTSIWRSFAVAYSASYETEKPAFGSSLSQFQEQIWHKKLTSDMIIYFQRLLWIELCCVINFALSKLTHCPFIQSSNTSFHYFKCVLYQVALWQRVVIINE